MIPFAILAVADEDDRAFITSLYINYRALMRKHALSVLKSSQDVEDIINDAFVCLIDRTALLKNMDSCTLPSYIVSTVRRVAIDFIKHRDVASKHIYLGQLEDALEAIIKVDDGLDFERFIDNREAARTAVKQLNELSERDRTILECKYILDMSDKDIASLLNIQSQSVRQYLTRARRNAMELLRKGGITSVTNI